MTWLIITLFALSIVFLALAFAVDYNSDACGMFALFGVLSFIAAVAVAIATDPYDDSEHQRYQQEAYELCGKQGGRLDEGFCIKDGKMIEFSPGVWRR